MEVKHNTLYLTTQNSYVSRDHLTLRFEVERVLKLRRTRRPPLDPMNCLLSFLYALVRHDRIAPLTAAWIETTAGRRHSPIWETSLPVKRAAWIETEPAQGHKVWLLGSPHAKRAAWIETTIASRSSKWPAWI